MKQREYAHLVVTVLVLLTLASCSNDSSGPQPALNSGDGTLAPLTGTYQLQHIQCGPVTSPGYSDQVLTAGLLVQVVYSGTKAVRTSTVPGACTQTIPMDPIQYLPKGQLKITDGTSSCAVLGGNATGCDPFSQPGTSICGVAGYTDTFGYQIDGKKLTVTLNLADVDDARNPCAGTTATQAVFTYQQVN